MSCSINNVIVKEKMIQYNKKFSCIKYQKLRVCILHLYLSFYTHINNLNILTILININQ